MRRGFEREGIGRAEPEEAGASVANSNPLMATQDWEARNPAVNLVSAKGSCWDVLLDIQVS